MAQAGIPLSGSSSETRACQPPLPPTAARRYTRRRMLAHLSLKHFAVVSEAELAFGPGLTVISGETGAGKSLLVDALGLLSGLRADSGVVRHGADRAELVGEFTLADVPAAADWLRDNELDEDGAGEATTRSEEHTSELQ